MKILDLKKELHMQIDTMSKVHLNNLYGHLRNLIQGEIDLEHWANLSDEEKQGILEAVKQSENGQVTSHEEVMKKVRKRYGLS